jgi:hypothetical protein
MKKQMRINRVLAAALVLLLSFGVLSGCGDDDKGTQSVDEKVTLEQILSDPWYYTSDEPVEFDQPVNKLMKSGGFEYEKAEAQKFFGGKPGKVSASERNQFVKTYGTGAFDKSGTGVFLIGDPEFSGMNHSGFYLEYTSDKGNTWKLLDGAYYDSAYVTGVRISGKKVYIFLTSEPAMKSYILYSDDLCRNFRIRDVITLLPDYVELMYCHTAGVELIKFDSETGAMTLGWSDADYTGREGAEGAEAAHFLIASFNGELTEGSVDYADDEYIRNTAEKIGDFEEINE